MNARRKVLIVAVAGVAALAGAAFAWKNGKGDSVRQPGENVALVERPLELIPDELHVIRPRGLVDTVRFTGTTQPVNQTIVKSRVAGRLADVLVREGDEVAEGQVLARFETTELQARFNERKSAVGAARAELRWAARDRSDKEALASRNIVSQAALDQARANAEQKTSMVAVAEAQFHVAEKHLADAEVRAPFAGVVGERIANQGESLPIDGKILTLLDTSRVEVAAQMPAADVVRMRVGQHATVLLEGFGDKPFNGRVTRISPTAQPGSRSILVFVEIQDGHQGLRGGLFGMGTINVQEKGHALAVPFSAMRKDDEGDFVLAVIDDTLVRKPVGAVRTWSRGELVEVKGLESGLRIVSAPLPGLKAGQRVKPIQTR